MKTKPAEPRRSSCRVRSVRTPRTRAATMAAKVPRMTTSEEATLVTRRTLKVRRLGRLEYGAALRIQKETEALVKRDGGPDTLLLVEHPHVLTLGRRATRALILASEEELQRAASRSSRRTAAAR